MQAKQAKCAAHPPGAGCPVRHQWHWKPQLLGHIDVLGDHHSQLHYARPDFACQCVSRCLGSSIERIGRDLLAHSLQFAQGGPRLRPAARRAVRPDCSKALTARRRSLVCYPNVDDPGQQTGRSSDSVGRAFRKSLGQPLTEQDDWPARPCAGGNGRTGPQYGPRCQPGQNKGSDKYWRRPR